MKKILICLALMTSLGLAACADGPDGMWGHHHHHDHDDHDGGDRH